MNNVFIHVLYFCYFFHFDRPINNYSGVSKVDMSEDIEPTLSKLDVVLTFSIEVRSPIANILLNDFANFN